MKKMTFWGCVLVFLILGTVTSSAQDNDQKKIKVQKRTLMGQFESDYVLSVSERIALKQSRIAHQYRTKELLDSLDIPDRKRKKLLKELKRNPFSEHLQQAIAKETKPDDSAKEKSSN
ncbi:hypothetical protein ACNR9Q_12965 [Maribacter sp. X9]|uniref:hypothetical protein n=1 Tax=Maribacter sp. X9 TaxID=3402159 RepID=UPI003AF38EC6